MLRRQRFGTRWNPEVVPVSVSDVDRATECPQTNEPAP